MSEAKHTPGPWLVEGRTVYALIHSGWKKGVQQFKNRFYASVQLDHEAPDAEAEANTRLIAAAPDLLEERDRLREEKAELLVALKAIVDGSFFGTNTGYTHCFPKSIADGRKAIAKAEGRAE